VNEVAHIALQIFENQSKLMITLERYLLEIVAFDFRARNPAEVLASLCHAVEADKVTSTAALTICLDAHRTLAVLKQTRQTLSCACLELAARFLGKDISAIAAEDLYGKLGTTRGEVTGRSQNLPEINIILTYKPETIRDLIELYMNHQPQTVAGPRFNLNDFMSVSIAVSTEMREKSLPRYTYYHEPPPRRTTSPTTSPHTDVKSTPTIHNTPRTPGPSRESQQQQTNGNNHVSPEDMDLGDPKSPPPEYMLQAVDVSMTSASPTSPTSPIEPPNPDDPSQITSLVRFVLDASRAHDEKLTIAPYYEIIEEEITEERDVWIPKADGRHRSFEKDDGPRRSFDKEDSRSATPRIGAGTASSATRIHGGFLSRGPPTENTPRRTYTPPPSSTANRGSFNRRESPMRGNEGMRNRSPRRDYRRETSPRRAERSPPSRGGAYARRGGDREGTSPPPRRGYGDDRGYRRDDRRDDRRRDYH
jgi:hypothetical protein